MYDYIKGILVEINPTAAIVECNGIGYFINISLNTYSRLKDCTNCIVFIHQVVREDAHVLFGFADKKEREIFQLLISVSGIGPNTARIMLSSLNPDEISNAIIGGNVAQLQSIKGIGAKTAQRVIIELKDKVFKSAASGEIFSPQGNTIRTESLSALLMLGYQKASVEKILTKLLAENSGITVEELVKKALKLL